MMAPTYSVRRFGADGTLISETTVDAAALQAQFDAEGLAARIRKMRQQIPGEPATLPGALQLLGLLATTALLIAAFSGDPA